jgi:hypothetical protein
MDRRKRTRTDRLHRRDTLAHWRSLNRVSLLAGFMWPCGFAAKVLHAPILSEGVFVEVVKEYTAIGQIQPLAWVDSREAGEDQL